MLERELKLKSSRVEALEKEVVKLREQLYGKPKAAERSTVAAPGSVGFGSTVSARPLREIVSPRRQVDPNAPPAPVPRVVSLGAAKMFKSSTEDDVPKERQVTYHAGKHKVTCPLPQEYVGVVDKNVEPSENLNLNLIRGLGAGRNLVYSANGQLYYTAGLVGVGLNTETWQQSFFNQHTEDVLCIAVHEGKGVAATGQLDPKGRCKPNILIWSLADRSLLKRIVFHDRAVINLQFSDDGKYLFSMGGDNDQTTAVWEWETFQHLKGKPVSPLTSIATCKFFNLADGWDCFGFKMVPGATDRYYPYVTMGRKHLSLWEFIPTDPNLKEEKGGRSKLVQTKLILVSHADKTQKVPEWYNGVAAVGENYYIHAQSGDLFKMKGASNVSSVGATLPGFGCVVRCPGGLAVAGQGKFGGRVVFWTDKELSQDSLPLPSKLYELKEPADFRPIGGCFHNGNLIVQLKSRQLVSVDIATGAARMIVDGHSGDVYGVYASPLGGSFASVAMDKTARFWSHGSTPLSADYRLDLKAGGKCVTYSPDGALVAIGTDNGSVMVVEASSYKVLANQKIAAEEISCLAFSPDGSCLAVGSLDQKVYVLNAGDLSKLQSMKGHTSSVMHVQWSADGQHLQTDSRDYQLMYWDVATGKAILRQMEIMDQVWAKWNSILGWPVQGIWNIEDDGTDVNNVDVSSQGHLLLAADDNGVIRLFTYPSLGGSKHKTCTGHSSHVTDARFNSDSSKVYSSGGNDFTVMEWNVSS